MIRIIESRKLLDIQVIYDKFNNSFTLNNNGFNKLFFGSIDEFRSFLKRYKFVDDLKEPRSKRAKTYLQMATDIIEGKDRKIMCWSNMWNQIKFRTTNI